MPHHQRWLAFIILFLTCSARADDFDDFTNNLFSDLAPIIALFGERVTTQFLSQALGWADCIALAMAPIGIITIIVSAIRVGGPMWLRAVVGRAKENMSNIEMELMSSTSREVCDLYNGTSIVRSPGTAPVWEYICLFPKGSTGSSSAKPLQTRFMTLKQAVESGLLEELVEPQRKIFAKSEKVTPESPNVDGDSQAKTTSMSTKRTLRHRLPFFSRTRSKAPVKSDAEQGTSHAPSDGLHVQNDQGVLGSSTTMGGAPVLTIIRDTGFDAPNISLNLQNTHNRIWIRLVATIGVILQSGVMIFFGLMTHPKFNSRFQRDDKPVATHAAPMAVTGTGLVVLGMAICGHVIESSTKETRYRTTKDFEISMYWVQQEQTVADQVFESFATNPSSPLSIITMSRRKIGHPKVLNLSIMRVKTTVGAFIGLVGFVVQFIGLRAMNSWATLAQLVAIGIMTFLRAIVRPGFTKSFEKAKLLPGFELDWLAWKLVKRARGEEKRSDSSDVRSTTGSTESSDPGKKHISPGSWVVNTGGSVVHQPFNEFTTTANDPTPRSISEAHDIMTMRRGLCKLAGFQGKTSSMAVNLALAIERAMKVLFPHGTETQVYRWYLDIVHSRTDSTKGSKQQVWFDISYSGASWEVLADNFDACLSLWNYAIQSREQQSGEGDKLCDSEGIEDDSWLRARRSGTCFRLLGPKEEQLVQNLKWWAPQGTETVLEVTETVECEPTTIRDSSTWRTFETVDYTRVVGHSPHIQPLRSEINGRHTFEIATLDASGNWEGISLAIETRDSLIDLYAKDLLFSFMCSAASTLKESIQSKTELRPTGAKFSAYSACSIWNQDLADLAEAFCELGFGHEQEAFMGIVSPLSKAQKLPFPEALFDSASSEIMKVIHSTTGTSDSRAIGSLENLAFRYQPGDMGIWERHIALQIEFVTETSMAIDLIRKENPYTLAVKLQELRNEAKFALKFGASDVVWNCLAYLYKKQCRQMSKRIRELETLASDEPPQFPDSLNLTELHRVAMSNSGIQIGDIEPSRLTAEYINKQDICHWTALHYAAVRGNLVFVEYLLSRDSPIRKLVDVNLRDFRGYTALHYACEQDRKDIMLALLDGEAGLEARGFNGVTPMHLAAGNKSGEVVDQLFNELLDFRESVQRSVPLADCNGRLPIHWAAIGGQVMSHAIFEHQLNEADNLGWTPLHLAAVYNQLGVIDELLELFADKDKKDKAGRTALYMACKKGHLGALKRLHEAGADCNSAADDGKTPLHEAAALQPEEVTLAREEGSTEFPLEKDHGTGIELVKILVSGQADPESKDDKGKTPIDIAAEKGHTEVLNYLRRQAKKGSQTKLTEYWERI